MKRSPWALLAAAVLGGLGLLLVLDRTFAGAHVAALGGSVMITALAAASLAATATIYFRRRRRGRLGRVQGERVASGRLPLEGFKPLRSGRG